MVTRIHPTDGSAVTSSFRSKSRPTHNGTDYRAPTGTPLVLPEAGTVTKIITNHRTAGNYVEVTNTAGAVVMTYSHMSQIKVAKGQQLAAGAVVGLAGDTGNARGAHLHFGVKIVRGDWINPVPWLKGQQTSTAPKPTKPATSSTAGVLRIGSTGAKVKELQRVLNAWYPAARPALRVDGIYGAKTAGRVRYMQARSRIQVDGIAGPETLGVLHIN